MSTFVVEVKTALEHVINQSSQDKNDRQERHKKAHVGEVLGRTLKHVSMSINFKLIRPLGLDD